jgi:hypothetical protein
MGVYSDYLAHTGVVDVTGDKVANQRSAYSELAGHAGDFDPACPSFLEAKDAVKVVNKFVATVSGGNFTLTITDFAGTTYTTASILYNASAATIEAAIDTACNGSLPSFVDEDISVALAGDLTANAMTVTFDGDSVTGENMDISIADVDLSGGGGINTVATTTYGQDKRYAWAIMWAHGMITSVPVQGAAMAVGAGLDVTPASTTAHWPRAALRKMLALEASIDDANVTLKGQLETLFNVE